MTEKWHYVCLNIAGLHSLSPTMLSGTLYSSVVEVGLTPSASVDDRDGRRANESGISRLDAFLQQSHISKASYFYTIN